jgi:hypothetical protein
VTDQARKLMAKEAREAARQAALAKALRENLKRRKAATSPNKQDD